MTAAFLMLLAFGVGLAAGVYADELMAWIFRALPERVVGLRIAPTQEPDLQLGEWREDLPDELVPR